MAMATISWGCENCGVRHVDDAEVCPGARRCCVCGWIWLRRDEVLLAASTPRWVVDAVQRQTSRQS